MLPHSLRKQQPNIFLTGGSGVIGQALLARLNPSSVTCLLRQTDLNVPGISTVRGDICLPRFGLDRSQLQDLANRIDCIVHCAALTDFTREGDIVFRTNVHSLESVLELAALAHAPLFHISTAFVRPCKTDTAEPSYAISKREGERLVSSSGVQHVIIRPSIVVGDSTSGAITRFQGFHTVIGAFLNGMLPMMPASPKAYVDFIPQDVVAETIVALINEWRIGEDYWITSGHESLTIERIGAIVKEFAQSLGKTMDLPRFFSRDTVDRLILPVFLAELAPPIRRKFERLLQISSYLCIDEPFTSSMPELRSRLNLTTSPPLELAFKRGLAYWSHATGYGKRLARLPKTPAIASA